MTPARAVFLIKRQSGTLAKGINKINMDGEKKPNGVKKIIEYLKASIEEMKKVTWPTKKETYNYTLLVIFISLGVALFLGLLDIIFTKGLEYLIINR